MLNPGRGRTVLRLVLGAALFSMAISATVALLILIGVLFFDFGQVE